MELRQQLKLTQQLVMTPQLQQAIKLLQLSRMELVDVVRQEVEENPALEESLEGYDSESRAAEEIADQAPEPTARPNSEPADLEARQGSREIDWEKYLENHANQAPMTGGMKPGGAGADELPSIEATLGNTETLAEHLRWQMRMAMFTDEEQAFVNLVIGNLDGDGYLKEPSVAELAEEAELDPEDAEEVLAMVQMFDPVGVAARDLRECLMAQVKALELDADVRDIVDRHLANLEKHNYQAIARDLGIEVDEVYEVARIVAGLEPRPARNFVAEQPRYIIPDVVVHKVGENYFVVPNDDGLPRLRIAGFFRTAMDAGPEAREYIQNKMRSAQWLIRSIEQRRRTIVKVTECIIEKQREFFDNGIKHLRPMILRDVADAVGMHESTISRVTTNKYVQTPQGIFELKYFFNSSIRRSEDDDIASESVKIRIREIIGGEDPRHPWSDQKIVKTLRDEGIVIARRTVAKYREMLGILSSARRRKYY